MNIQTLVEKVTDAIKALSNIKAAEIPVIAEEKGDVSTSLQTGIAKSRVAVIVGWSGFQNEATSSKTPFGSTTIVLSIFEQPLLNRAKKDAVKALELAQELAREINLFSDSDLAYPLVFRRISPISELQDGKTITVDVEFTAKATL